AATPPHKGRVYPHGDPPYEPKDGGAIARRAAGRTLSPGARGEHAGKRGVRRNRAGPRCPIGPKSGSPISTRRTAPNQVRPARCSSSKVNTSSMLATPPPLSFR